MRENQSVICPACGEATVAKRKTLMDGFRKRGEVLVCMLCGEQLAEVEEAPAAAAKPAAAGALADLLGGVEREAVPTLAAQEGEGHFCRDCGHYLAHPFLSRCILHEREVNPMDDCSDWCPKSSREEKKQ